MAFTTAADAPKLNPNQGPGAAERGQQMPQLTPLERNRNAARETAAINSGQPSATGGRPAISGQPTYAATGGRTPPGFDPNAIYSSDLPPSYSGPVNSGGQPTFNGLDAQQNRATQTPAQTPTETQPTSTTDPFGSVFDPNQGRYIEDFYNAESDIFSQRSGSDFIDQSGAFEVLSTPGEFEQFYGQNAESFGAPGAGEQHWEGLNGSQNQFTQGYQGPNNAQTAFNDMRGAMPGSVQPTFDTAYDRALDKGVSALNTQAASRGNYGSSSALTGVGGVISDIEAARAKEAGDFALRDQAEQRAWRTGIANAGRGADLSGIGQFDAGLRGITEIGGLALDVGDQQLARDKFAGEMASEAQIREQDRLSSAADLAFAESNENLSALLGQAQVADMADNSYTERAQNAFENNQDYLNSMLGFINPSLAGIIDNDQATQEDIWRSEAGQAILGQKYQEAIAAGNNEAAKTILDLYTGGATAAIPNNAAPAAPTSPQAAPAPAPAPPPKTDNTKGGAY